MKGRDGDMLGSEEVTTTAEMFSRGLGGPLLVEGEGEPLPELSLGGSKVFREPVVAEKERVDERDLLMLPPLPTSRDSSLSREPAGKPEVEPSTRHGQYPSYGYSRPTDPQHAPNRRPRVQVMHPTVVVSYDDAFTDDDDDELYHAHPCLAPEGMGYWNESEEPSQICPGALFGWYLQQV